MSSPNLHLLRPFAKCYPSNEGHESSTEAQLLLQAKDAAHAASNAAHRSAKATWSALERMTQAYTNTRQYYMLDDLVEATSAAKKVMLQSSVLHQTLSTVLKRLHIPRAIPRHASQSCRYHIHRREDLPTISNYCKALGDTLFTTE